MRTRRAKLGGLVMILASVTAVVCLAAAPPPRVDIQFQDDRETFFGGQQVGFRFTVRSTESLAGRLAWVYSADRRTLAAREIGVTVDSASPAELEVALQLPEVREGVVYDTQLTFRLMGRANETLAERRRVLRIFARDPWASRQTWLQRLNIGLYDPDGKTLKTFQDAGIPCKPARSLEESTARILVIGEGVSLHRALPNTLLRLAAGGGAVLCLAPADGRLPFPGSEEGQAQPSRVCLHQSDIVRDLDKRLDAFTWSAAGSPVIARLSVMSQRGQVYLEVPEKPQGWPWAEAVYPGGGRLIVCGLGIIRHWDAGPTPRYLLLRILERLEPRGKPAAPSRTQE